jgi:hypothetical protein
MSIVSVNILGGLGNQLFQIATAYAYARREKGELQIEHIQTNGNRPLYWDTLLHRVHPYLVQKLPSMDSWYEPGPTTFGEIGPLSPSGKYLRGYLQSSKYFYNDEIKEEIRELFQAPSHIVEQVQTKYKDLMDQKDRVVIVHCRRTDYITFQHVHGPLPASYYKEAIQRMLNKVSNPIFLLCGDDSSFWNEIREEIKPVWEHEYRILDETDIYTFILLQQFQNVIMANSTFIWWTTWLSKATNVIVPSKWFGPSGPKEWEDIYEPSWHRV